MIIQVYVRCLLVHGLFRGKKAQSVSSSSRRGSHGSWEFPKKMAWKMGFRALHETAINWKNPIENVNEIKI